MPNASKQSALEAALADLNRPVPAKTRAEHLRYFASVQRRQALASLLTVTQTRRWAAKVSAYNPGVGQFYGVPATAETRARVAKFAAHCRKLANKACAEARELEAVEASAALKRAA
ncbi:MAG: hypothetical protein J7521_20225 [Caulobacter sp.]|nr:hypothetical protein [Caulobacter sp.]